MSTQMTEEEAEAEYQKTVTVVAYIKDHDHLTPREYADERDEDTDYYNQREYERTKYRLQGPGIDKRIDEDEYENLANRELGELEAKKITETERSFIFDPAGLTKKVLQEELADVDYSPRAGFHWNNGRLKIQNDDWDNLLSVRTYLDFIGLLKHPSEISDDDPWEDEDEELLAHKFRFSIKNVNEAEMDEITSRIVEPAIERLSKRGDIERVRWMDCEVQMTEKGACYNI